MKAKLTGPVCLAALLWTGWALAQAPAAPMPSGSGSAMPGGGAGPMGRGSQEMHQRMMGGGKAMRDMPLSGDVDKDFATMMRAHHQQAIEMAQVQIAHGRSPELKQMARKIIADQQKEIAQFDRWLAGHR